MKARFAFVLILLCVASGASVFELKNSVASMQKQLNRVNVDIAEEHRLIRTLEADWAHVTRPERLVQLAREVGMVRAGVQHVVSLSNIGRRAMLEMARYPVRVPLSAEAEGVFRVKPPLSMSLDRDIWAFKSGAEQ